MSISILTGDCIELMRQMSEKSVQCCVTSPPYFGLRVYNSGDKEIGRELTPTEYVSKMVEVFSEVKRVLREDGVLWLNLGDSYANDSKWGGSSGGLHAAGLHGESGIGRGKKTTGLKAKDLMMIPSRVAMALQADGWYLRAACPWIKRNGMPDSTQDRPTQCIETVFMLTKSKTCYYDPEAVKVVAKCDRMRGPALHPDAISTNGNGGLSRRKPESTRLRRTSDWFFESWQGMLQDEEGEPTAFVVNLKGYKEAHFATFPTNLVEPCILSATSEKGCCSKCGSPYHRQTERTPMVIDRSERTHDLGRMRSSGTMVSPPKTETTGWSPSCSCEAPPAPCVVIDPFGGSGTTGLVAKNHGRSAILLELNPDYVLLAQQRLGITPTMEFD